MNSPPTAPSWLQIDHLCKRFGTVDALLDVSLEIEEGEIHAILGENGAGKSTLMHILYGLLQPDRGDILLGGKPFRPETPLAARKCGLGMVHQHFTLVPTLSVTQNLLLGDRPRKLFLRGREDLRVRSRLRELGFELDPSRKVTDLSVGERQRVEIAKALWYGARLLILDEPTAVLAPQEVEQLFTQLNHLKSTGHTILFISHKLTEINRLCDRVSLLSKGRVQGTYKVSETGPEDLSRMLMASTAGSGGQGKVLDADNGHVKDRAGKTSFQVRCVGATNAGLTGNWSLDLLPGRIVGVAGIEGNGQQPLTEALLGLLTASQVTVFRGGKRMSKRISQRLREGLSYISDDRQKTGLVLDMDLTSNLALKDIGLSPWSAVGWLTPGRAETRTADLLAEFDVRPPHPQQRAGTLSGGNQQKVVVARELSRPHDLLVASNPSRGLDLNAQQAVATALRQDAARGTAVLLVSTDLDEVLDLATDLWVIHDGQLTPVLPDQRNREEVGRLMLGLKNQGGEAG